MIRDPDTGDWTSHVFGTKLDHHTRPIVMLDGSNGRAHMFATAPEAGGSIYHKVARMNNPAFASGRGNLFIHDALSEDVNDATGSKQSVNLATGLPILASDDTRDLYWHNYDALQLGAAFAGAPTTGTGPLAVRFTDGSSGYPESWLWEFGDGSSSVAQSPTHTYTQPGTYTVRLTITDAAGNSSTRTRTDYVTVYPSVTFAAAADAFTSSTLPDKNYGTYTTLRARYQELKTIYRSYLSFDVVGLSQPVVSAKLRLYVTNASKVGGTLHNVPSAWGEMSITWNNAPAMDNGVITTVGNAALDSWKEIELPSALFAAGDGTYRFGIQSTSADDVWYASRETGTPPQLVLGIPSS